MPTCAINLNDRSILCSTWFTGRNKPRGPRPCKAELPNVMIARSESLWRKSWMIENALRTFESSFQVVARTSLTVPPSLDHVWAKLHKNLTWSHHLAVVADLAEMLPVVDYHTLRAPITAQLSPTLRWAKRVKKKERWRACADKDRSKKEHRTQDESDLCRHDNRPL